VIPEIQLDSSRLKTVKKAFRALDPKQQKRVWATSISEAVRTFRTQSAKRTRERYTVKAAKFKQAIRVKEKSAVDMSATIQISGTHLPLTDFTVKAAPLPSKSFKRQVTEAMAAGSSLPRPDISPRVKVLQRGGGFKQIASSFMGRMPSGNAVLVRKTSQQYPTQTQVGLAAAQMAGHKEVLEPVSLLAMETLATRINHNIARAMGGN